PIGLKLAFETTPEGRLHTLWRPKQEHVGFKDLIHGGLVATVLDEVMARVIYERGMPGVTAVMETKLLRPLRWGREYRFTAWVVRERSKTVETEAEAVDVETGERAASGKATFVRRQS
ncbi:MAG TPA: PaaI family thioesterase, partial [Candidatus Eisenbacteria bacterium]|nr:PaaI family thioesterase [Candidatus Eisenbacteria bacterium]